jgi:thiosulfate/3-mercaptopyruvate sulfurtransferase
MMRGWWGKITVFAALLVSAGAGAAVEEPRSLEALRHDGHAVSQALCARCHGKDGSDTSYADIKSLVEITQRYDRATVLRKSEAFAGVRIEPADGAALYAFLGTFREGKWPRPELLVETSWVETHLRQPKVRLVDMRSAAAYHAGHIPGAVRIEEGPLRDPRAEADYLPKPEAFAAMMGKAGIDRDTEVVIYDDQGGRSAARLWFVLNAYGHQRVSLVNGGWLKWTAEKRPGTQEVPQVSTVTFTPKKVPSAVCVRPELLARKPNVVVLDTRSEAEYRAGHIPNAVQLDWRETVTGPHQEFKSAPELKKLLESKGITPDKEVATY